MIRKRRKQGGSIGRPAAVLALLALPLLTQSLPGQEVIRQDLRQDLRTPGGAQPIEISADAIITWRQGDRRVVLLRGSASATQGGVIVRMPQAVVWIDEDGRKRTGAYDLDLYGESGFEIEAPSSRQVASQGLVRLTTRGELRFLSRKEKAQEAAAPADPVYQRGEQLRAGPAGPARLAVAPPQIIPPAGPVQGGQTQTVSATVAPPALSNLVRPLSVAQAPPVEPPPPVPNVPPSVNGGPGGGSVVPKPLPGGTPQPAKGAPRSLSIRPRSMSANNSFQSYPLDGETAYVYTGGIILTMTNPNDTKKLLDVEADRVVVWAQGDAAKRLAGPQGETSGQMEFYLSGHVEIRFLGAKGQTETLLCDEAYYDVGRSVAIALQADLELREKKLPYPVHLKAPEVLKLNATTYEASPSEVYSSTLPSDPGLRVELRKTTIVEREDVRTSIFGIPLINPKTGQADIEKLHYFTGRDMVVRLEGVPIFYFPYFAGNVEDPLGPLDAVSFNYNRIFGFQVFTTWDMFELLGSRRPQNQNWRLFVDYLTARGPALGMQYDYYGTKLFGIPGRFENLTKAYGIYDTGHDTVGSGGQFAFVTPIQTVPLIQPNWRGRFLERLNAQDMPYGFMSQIQVSLLSDRNYLEQYYQNEFFNDLNQETFIYVKQQQGNWAWTALGETWQRDWVTETEWYPKLDGYLIGQTIFDRLVYNAHASIGYAQLRPTAQAPPPFLPTDVRTDTGRADLMQDVSLPFMLGPFNIVPYLVGDLTYYTSDVNDTSAGRAYGGGGLRASIPFSKLYPDVCSELWNLSGIYHKIVLSANYFNAGSTIPHTRLPQLDRLDDDVTDFTLRNMHVLEPNFYGLRGVGLVTSPLFFDPQTYAIRRLVQTQIDTLDSIQVVQMDLRQRWQTKRGFPGSEHVVDWMTFDIQASIFPDAHRDNFNRTVGIVEYDWTWNIGDRTALFSSGWTEPFNNGPRVFNVGTTLGRPDSTSLTLSYRQIDPLNSRAIIAAITYPFSAKYALTAATVWDFGVSIQSYSLTFSRIGTDVQINLGVSYNSVLNTVGVTFEIIPNLLRGSLKPGMGPVFGGVPGTGIAQGR